MKEHNRPRFPVEKGSDAGDYLCEELCYEIGEAMAENESIVKDGHFVHIPPLEFRDDKVDDALVDGIADYVNDRYPRSR